MKIYYTFLGAALALLTICCSLQSNYDENIIGYWGNITDTNTNVVFHFDKTGVLTITGVGKYRYIATNGVCTYWDEKFPSLKNNFSYTVSAGVLNYAGRTMVRIELSRDSKIFTSFGIVSPEATGEITGTNILVVLPEGSGVTSLIAKFTTTGVSVKIGSNLQVSGKTVNDFTNPVVYTVIADDGTIQKYLVRVNRNVCISRIGLVAEYLFNGNANDTSGNGNNGTVYGAVLTTDRKGNTNSAYGFDGANDYIESVNNISITGSADRTVCIWLNPLASSKVLSFLGWGQGYSSGDNFLKLAPSGTIILNFNYNDHYTPTNVVLRNKWQLITSVYSGGVMKMYVDNKLTTNISMSINTGASPLTLGMVTRLEVVSGWSDYFYGSIDDVRIYNRVLTSDEIMALYKE